MARAPPGARGIGLVPPGDRRGCGGGGRGDGGLLRLRCLAAADGVPDPGPDGAARPESPSGTGVPVESIPVEPNTVQAVRALDQLSAPSVLDRLVEEELARPLEARTARFAGDLEPLRAPRRLDSHVVAHARGRLVARRWLAPAVALAAATVLAWIGGGQLGWWGDAGGHAPAMVGSAYESYSFRVVRPTSLRDMDPTARSLAEALVGSTGRAD